jgi:hypothetical protein
MDTLIDKIWAVIYALGVIFLAIYLYFVIQDMRKRGLNEENFHSLATIFFAFAIATAAGFIGRTVQDEDKIN